MARQELVLYKDDLDGSEKDVRPVPFQYQGTQYTIDLSPANHKKLQKVLAPYIQAGTKVSSRASAAARGSSTRRSSAAEHKEFNSRVRDWAAANGHTVKPRGRIPEPVIDAYRKAGGR